MMKTGAPTPTLSRILHSEVAILFFAIPRPPAASPLRNRDLNPLLAARNPHPRPRLRRQRPTPAHQPHLVHAGRKTVEEALARGVEAGGGPVAPHEDLQRDEVAVHAKDDRAA